KPAVKDDEVLVRLRAASIHKGDWHLMKGEPYIIRLGFGLRKPKHSVPGSDIAGTVEAVGKDVQQFQAGDEVFGWCTGAFAEYAVATADNFVPKPDELTFEMAAAVGNSAFAALHALRDQGKVQPGQKVLILGASGGVGTFAVQMAKAFGAEVTAVCSTRNVDMVRSIGADHVIDYTREDFAQGEQRYELILDIFGNRSLADSRRMLTRTGTYVLVGGSAGRWFGLSRQAKALVLSPFVSQTLRVFISMPRHEDLETIRDLVATGKVMPVISRTYPLSETAAAMAQVGRGHAQGKTVITV
ncbi:MAG: NAD(P)-dependent alcohol dehydrogenase, partial [Chloroflexota bacterium]